MSGDAADGQWTLWGLPHSLYTGPVRAYLRKAGVPFVERSPFEQGFREQIASRIGRVIIPVVSRGAELVQDSVDILDHFESIGPTAGAYPMGPRQRLLATLLQLYGNQGLLRMAMHYRWSRYPEQARFLDHAFGFDTGGERASRTMEKMRSYLPGLGVTPATMPLIERSYEELLNVLEAHFARYPFLLGGRPSIGDYGLLGPLFAHLGRDPVPADLMKRRAPAVARWVERMNAPDADLVDFPDQTSAYLHDDVVPPTLLPLVVHMGLEMAGDMAVQLDFLQRWVTDRNPADGEPVSDRPGRRTLGTAPSIYRGESVEIGVSPYLLYLIQRVRRAIAALSGADHDWARALLDPYGLWQPLTRKLDFSVMRRAHLEVWSRSLA